MNEEFLLEKKLSALRPDLAANFHGIAFAMDHILNKTISFFPEFTDHTIRHSIIVIEQANQIIGREQIERLNADEIYILLCAAYMHDFGMTISEKDFDEMKEGIVPEHFMEEHPDKSLRDIVRMYHNYFSEKLILKYAGVFEFPSEEYTYCIAKVSKGHRKTDLFDENEFNPSYRLANGNIVRIPYLAAVLRLCDEMDITIERNSLISYEEHEDTLSYQEHFAIKQLIIEDERFTVKVETADEAIREACENVIKKLNETLQYCVDAAKAKTDLEINQKRIEVFFSYSGGKMDTIILGRDI